MVQVWVSGVDVVGTVAWYNVEIRTGAPTVEEEPSLPNSGSSSVPSTAGGPQGPHAMARCTKRFSDFVRLRNALGVAWSLPSRLSTYYRSASSVVETRRQALEAFSRYLLNDDQFRLDERVLGFFNVGRALILEDAMLAGAKTPKRVLAGTQLVDSPRKWMETYKLCNTTLQDARNQLFAQSDPVALRSALRTVSANLLPLSSFIEASSELSEFDRNSRKALMENLERELHEVESLAREVSGKVNLGGGEGLLNTAGRSRRTLGGPVETAETRNLNTASLLQTQQERIKAQDQHLDQLREVVRRQRQMGEAINEELAIQNELLAGLDDAVDASERKLATAREKVKRLV